MEKCKFVFVILVYKNSDDLVECLDSIRSKVNNYKVIVVNSYFDDETMIKIKGIAEDNGCVFINVENKGYSYGNNVGIEYASKEYDFSYLVVSNPDIIIGNIDEHILDDNTKYDIIAPKIIARSGKKQNPMSVRKSNLACKLEYKGFLKNKKGRVLLGIALNKFYKSFRVFFHFNKKKPYRIYAAHGSFVIFTQKAIQKLIPVYDENIFLFAEESVLAERAKENKLLTGQFNSIVVYHKEDGSMKLADFSIGNELRKANIYFYENYVFKKK